MWRGIFFSLSSGITPKTVKEDIDGSRNYCTNGKCPEIDIRRLVDFLHTRDVSSRKVFDEIFCLFLSILTLYKNLSKYVVSTNMITFAVGRTNRTSTSSTCLHGIIIKIQSRQKQRWKNKY